MNDINKEINKITEQKEWDIPANVLEKVGKIKADKNALEEEIDSLEAQLEVAQGQKKLAHIKMWKTIHELMPDVPLDNSLRLDMLEKKIKIRFEK